MAATPVRTLRVRKGSALERLTKGRDFTATIHQLAEMYERALIEQSEQQAAIRKRIELMATIPSELLGELVFEEL